VQLGSLQDPRRTFTAAADDDREMRQPGRS
jgi:hypothetical protein